ncbi:hypothetical protein Q5P01_016382 [Channa striata]|uniref:Uncharacterized protein n=1 Tax=Channa striata TaxID=64152 RepID=A0AA88MDY4_CHASR|nr:hypothetical protein Q5P01_016382 [Channa striata]
MHAGYKHTQGIDGFPKDLDMAYSYYANAGAQTSIDTSRIHSKKQYTPEDIYLSNPEDLNRLTDETGDIFQYLKLQAERGDLQAQKRLGTMLYWGQNGVSKDIASAVKWFERSAMQMKDPSAAYDFAILLMKGQGVRKNQARGFQLLKKAADMGSINALNGLGWRLPSRFGHVTASAGAARYLSTGSLEGVSQDVEMAVIMLKKVCERNGHLGFMIREALRAYLKGSWQEAFVKYFLAAETGLGLAQSNVAHLCEDLNLSYDCQWRYHNYSVLHFDPHPSGEFLSFYFTLTSSSLLKMGDYYYSASTQENSLSLVGQAVSMYSRAALAGSPQGMYNLVVLLQQGHALPSNVHGLFNVSRHEGRNVVGGKILKSCVEAENKNAVTPCSLALLGLQMGKALRRMTQNGAQLLLTYASLLSVCVLLVVVPLQSCLKQKAPIRRGHHLQARTSSVSQDAANLNREQDGIVGGTYTVAGTLRLITLNRDHWLRRTSDLAVTLSGVCLCALWTTLLYHLL